MIAFKIVSVSWKKNLARCWRKRRYRRHLLQSLCRASVKSHGCQLILPSDSFSRTQLGKPRGRKCQACLSSNTISVTPSDCNGSSRACGPSDELSAAGIISSLVSAPGVTSENMGSSLPASLACTSSLSSMGSDGSASRRGQEISGGRGTVRKVHSDVAEVITKIKNKKNPIRPLLA